MRQRYGLGHNRGPALDGGTSWRTHCWRRSRADLIGKRLPIEVVRSRVRRAQALGLEYPQYASILMGSGRDIVGFLFTCDAMGLRLRRRLEMPEPVRDKLAALRCSRLAVAPEGEPPEDFRAELVDVAGVAFAAGVAPPRDGASWADMRRALREALEPICIPASALVLVGTTETERIWADAANLARFLPAEGYFRHEPGEFSAT